MPQRQDRFASIGVGEFAKNGVEQEFGQRGTGGEPTQKRREGNGGFENEGGGFGTGEGEGVGDGGWRHKKITQKEHRRRSQWGGVLRSNAQMGKQQLHVVAVVVVVVVFLTGQKTSSIQNTPSTRRRVRSHALTAVFSGSRLPRPPSKEK